MTLCSGETATTYWWINVQTGELTKDTTNGYPAANLSYPLPLLLLNLDGPRRRSP